MFPRGPRFNPPKIPDVPGPNTYNLDAESQLDAYKRGAFLEKTDRFSKEKASDVPGPGAYNIDAKGPAKSKPPAQSQSSHLAVLQRKLEDLEKLHIDGKKSHAAEVDRLKTDLARAHKSAADQSERLEKMKKQNDALDVRIQECKKAALADQAEAKDLRVKLRMSEHERTQLAAKHGEAGDAKKALQAAESRRKDEVRERDRRIADLEKALAGETRRREAAEAKMQEAKAKAEGDAETAQALRTQLSTAKDEARRAQESLRALEDDASSSEDALVQQLQQHQMVLARVAQDYGRLAAHAVPAPAHADLKHAHAALQIKTARLERKLANAEGQVIELAHLVRHTTDDNALLATRLRDAEDEAASYFQALKDHRAIPTATDDNDVFAAAATVERHILDAEKTVRDDRARQVELLGEWYRLQCGELLFAASVLDKAWSAEKALVQRHAADLAEAATMRDAFKTQLDDMRGQLDAMRKQLEDVRGQHENAQRELVAATAACEEEKAVRAAKVGAAQTEMREQAAQRLSAAAQKSKMAEEALRAEVEQLTAELTDAERFQEAYYSLSDEVSALLARNALAEGEAERLSTFNAEILGHHNPAQRIVYVDRVRRELAEMKQKLLVSVRAHEAATAANDELRRELEMYKSVMVPAEYKPRTHITRVGRVPLAAQSVNVDAKSRSLGEENGSGSHKRALSRTPELDSIPGDMTLDEIL
ncbi:hypothetical protein PLICRDRAFT_466038 [Plicaturopsis crispa FD-325 SS-3]|nr:hypothetical protein PLICRDRAFT_466038 [Plicaturopsis crispa FD-325 SS-3]